MSSSVPTERRVYRLPEANARGSLDFLSQLSTEAIPPLRATEVLLKTRAVSLNYRDIAIANGTYLRPTMPALIPCSDLSGEIVSLGSDVPSSEWKVGESVCANFTTDWLDGDVAKETLFSAFSADRDGVLAEYVAVPAHALVRIPANYSHVQASTLPCAAVTAYNALFGSSGHPLKPGDTLVVQGTGGVSIWALQLAKAAGARVIATSSSDDKLDIAKKLGADEGVNYKEVKEWGKKVTELTDGRGADHVIEVGGNSTLANAFEAVKLNGVISVIGFLGGEGEGAGLNPAALILSKAAILRGIRIGSVKQFKDLVRLLEVNKVRPVVDKVFKFEQAKEAFEYLQGQGHVGKVVIEID